MQTEFAVEVDHLMLFETDGGPRILVDTVGVRHYCVHGIVAARKLYHHEGGITLGMSFDFLLRMSRVSAPFPIGLLRIARRRISRRLGNSNGLRLRLDRFRSVPFLAVFDDVKHLNAVSDSINYVRYAHRST